MSPLLPLLILVGVSGIQGWWFWSTDEKKEEDDKICLATPQSDSHLQVEFVLFTREDPDGSDITMDTNSIQNSAFNHARDTKFITHGYTDKGSAPWVLDLVKEFLKYYDVNVICVNWEKGADSLFYGQSAANTRRVGEIVGDFILKLKAVTGAPLSSHHLIGHSLGAHISGFAGARTGGLVGRVTGLDPAGPCFRFADPWDRLSADDALFVDAIHTDGDLLLQAGFGTEVEMGDADFYPNGGEKQPGCDSWFWQHLIDLCTNWIGGFKSSLSCNHLRVLDLFRESVNPNVPFTSYPCSHYDDYAFCKTCGSHGCTRMGLHAKPDHKGIYTLQTHKSPPFCDDY